MKERQRSVDGSSVFCSSNNCCRQGGPLLTVCHWNTLCEAVCYSDFQGKLENIFQEWTLCKWWRGPLGSISLHAPCSSSMYSDFARVKSLLALALPGVLFFLTQLFLRLFFRSIQHSCQGSFSSGLDSFMWRNNLWVPTHYTKFSHCPNKFDPNLVCIVKKDLNISWKKINLSHSFLMYRGHIHYCCRLHLPLMIW